MDLSRFTFGTPSLPYSASLGGTTTVVSGQMFAGEVHMEQGYHHPLPDHHDPIGLALGGVAVFVFLRRL